MRNTVSKSKPYNVYTANAKDVVRIQHPMLTPLKKLYPDNMLVDAMIDVNSTRLRGGMHNSPEVILEETKHRNTFGSSVRDRIKAVRTMSGEQPALDEVTKGLSLRDKNTKKLIERMYDREARIGKEMSSILEQPVNYNLQGLKEQVNAYRNIKKPAQLLKRNLLSSYAKRLLQRIK